MSSGVRCMIMRGGSSKGAYFVGSDLPGDGEERDDLLLRIMGSPDGRQIDGIGGAHPLTSKVAIVTPSSNDDADIDYLFLQIGVSEPLVAERQNCGNLLAGVGPFAVERRLAERSDGDVSVQIRMLNTDSIATAQFQIADGQLVANGDTKVSGVPGTASPIRLNFEGLAGSSCGALLPTGNVVDTISGVDCTLVDNGMPVVVVRAIALGITGYESCAELEANTELTLRLEAIRLTAGKMMNLDDVSDTTVPKMTIVAPSRAGGDICTRTFIPHRCHDAIGVLGAVSVATAALLPGSPAAEVMSQRAVGVVVIEHPTGTFDAVVDIDTRSSPPVVRHAGIVRTARKLMDGIVYPRHYP